MYIQKLSIQNYRNFGDDPFQIELKPFTLLLGENNIGKTNLLNAVGLILSHEVGIFQKRMLELDDFNYATVSAFKKRVVDTDIEPAKIAFPEIVIEATLVDFDADQEAVVGDWFTDSSFGSAKLTYRFFLRASFDKIKWINQQRDAARTRRDIAGDNIRVGSRDGHWRQVEFPIGDYRYTIFGGGMGSNECETHHLRMLRADILDALRDARKELMAGGEPRLLYRILKQGADTQYADLKQPLLGLENAVEDNKHLQKLKQDVETLLRRVALHDDEEENLIDLRFSSPEASELLKKISMIYGDQPVDVARNGLGRNNLLYLSLVMSQVARVSTPVDNSYTCFRFVGVEEPEAHLHPHLQDHLARNIESIRDDHDKTMQLVLTSHSTNIAAKLSLKNTAVLFRDLNREKTDIAESGLEQIVESNRQNAALRSHYILAGLDQKKHEDSIRYLSLYLDATKSQMFFARRLILVEGISEQVLIEKLFQIHHKSKEKTFAGIGATVLNVNGVAFRHFLTVIKNGFFRRSVVLTDSDSGTQTQTRAADLKTEFDTPGLIEVCISTGSTFERDLIGANALAHGRDILLMALKDTKPMVGKDLEEKLEGGPIDIDGFFSAIADSKAEFAFNLAKRIDSPICGFIVPAYIVNAFHFLGHHVKG